MKKSIRLYTLFVSLAVFVAAAPSGFAQCTIGLDAATITSVKVENIGSQAWVDHIGNGQ